MGLDKAAGCKQTAFKKHLDVSDIHLRTTFNSHAHKLYKPKSVKELWTRKPFRHPHCKFLYWYQEFLCPVEPLYFSDEKSITVEK